MLIYLQKQATAKQIRDAEKDLDGYIKITIDIVQKAAVIGGRLHVDAEKMLLNSGSRQDDIWGGGYDIQSRQIDFNSIINLRPTAENPSEEIILPAVREKFEELLKYFFGL